MIGLLNFTLRHAAGRHYGPICKLEWKVREAGRSASHAESLICLAMDGRVTEWFTLKGFDFSGELSLPSLPLFIKALSCLSTPIKS